MLPATSRAAKTISQAPGPKTERQRRMLSPSPWVYPPLSGSDNFHQWHPSLSTPVARAIALGGKGGAYALREGLVRFVPLPFSDPLEVCIGSRLLGFGHSNPKIPSLRPFGAPFLPEALSQPSVVVFKAQIDYVLLTWIRPRGTRFLRPNFVTGRSADAGSSSSRRAQEEPPSHPGDASGLRRPRGAPSGRG